MRKNNSSFITSFVSEAGTFKTNRDYFAFVELDDLACWIAADDLNSNASKKAAEIAAHTIFEAFVEKPTLSRKKLRKYLNQANTALKNENLKASLVMVVTDYTDMVWIVAGNSRLYHLRNGSLNFKSKDQSIAQMIADAEKISEDDISDHKERNNLTNYIGKTNKFKPFISDYYSLEDGDGLLLCTSGFWENISSEEINAALRDASEPAEFVDNLEEALIKKQNEALNNYTIAAVSVNKIFKESKFFSRKMIRMTQRIVLVVLLLALIVTGVLYANKTIQAMKQNEKKPIPTPVAVITPEPTPTPQVQPEATAADEIFVTKSKIDKFETDGDYLCKDSQCEAAITEYRHGIGLARSINDQSSRARLEKKIEIAQILMEGNQYFAARKYQMALSIYRRAEQRAEQAGLPRKYVKYQIERTNNCLYVLALINDGDREMARKRHPKAKALYEKAMRISVDYSFELAKKNLQQKLNRLRTTTVTSQGEKEYAAAKLLENQGDEYASRKKWDDSVVAYRKAQDIYLKLKRTSDIESLDIKLKKAEKKSKSFFYRAFKVSSPTPAITPTPKPVAATVPPPAPPNPGRVPH